MMRPTKAIVFFSRCEYYLDYQYDILLSSNRIKKNYKLIHDYKGGEDRNQPEFDLSVLSVYKPKEV